jgi:pimeloyl-ACP methyl ester carboxylesterase
MVSTAYSVETTAGVVLNVSKIGHGLPVLIVHGSLASSGDWMGVADILSRDREVHVLDRRGHGGSGDSEDYDLRTEIEDVVAVLTTIDGPVTLVGHSYGAIVAIEAALQRPVSALVLYEPPLAVNGPVAGEALAPYADAVESGDNDGALVIGLRDILHVPVEAIEFLRTIPVWPQMAALAPTWTRELSQIDQHGGDVEGYRDLTTPTTLLLGDSTPSHHIDATNALASALRNATIIDLPGQGHFAHWEQPDVLARYIAAQG